MKTFSLTTGALISGLALVLSPVANLQAAELKILAGGAMTGPLKDLGAQFESASGHKIVFRFATTPELIKLATGGGPFDLGIVPVDVMKDAAAQVRFASGPTTIMPPGCSWPKCSDAIEKVVLYSGTFRAIDGPA